MPSHKAPGFSAVPADLFKQAPAPFQRRIHLLINEILVGEYDCDLKVILIHKDKDIAILDHFRPIVLLNTIYQLIMIIITSRLRQLSENYAVMEGSQCHRGVQMVVQRALWVQQQAMNESGTLIRIDLDFKNAFNSAGHSYLWVILRCLGVSDVDFLEDLYSNSWMKIQVGSGCSVSKGQEAWRTNMAAMSTQCPICNKKRKLPLPNTIPPQPTTLGMQTYVETLRNQI